VLPAYVVNLKGPFWELTLSGSAEIVVQIGRLECDSGNQASPDAVLVNPERLAALPVRYCRPHNTRYATTERRIQTWSSYRNSRRGHNFCRECSTEWGTTRCLIPGRYSSPALPDPSPFCSYLWRPDGGFQTSRSTQ
jgi:hypothetical protein